MYKFQMVTFENGKRLFLNSILKTLRICKY